MQALIVSAEGFEDTELLVPYYRLKEEGYRVEIASLARGLIQGKHGYRVTAERAVGEVDPASYDLLILPGGKAPAVLRQDESVLDLVRQFFRVGKPVAAICHGPQVLVSAGVLSGRTATCYRTVAEELRAAGVHYRDAEVVVDGNLVTSREPSDLPYFIREIMKKIREVTDERR